MYDIRGFAASGAAIVTAALVLTAAGPVRAADAFCSALTPIVKSVASGMTDLVTPSGALKAGKTLPTLPGALETETSGKFYKAVFHFGDPQNTADFAPFNEMEKKLNAQIALCFPGAKGTPTEAKRSSGTEYRVGGGVFISVITGARYRPEGGRDGSETRLGIAKAPDYFL